MPIERACTEATAPTTALIFSKIKYLKKNDVNI